MGYFLCTSKAGFLPRILLLTQKASWRNRSLLSTGPNQPDLERKMLYLQGNSEQGTSVLCRVTHTCSHIPGSCLQTSISNLTFLLMLSKSCLLWSLSLSSWLCVSLSSLTLQSRAMPASHRCAPHEQMKF